MLKHVFRIALLVASWLLITACGNAQKPRFLPPDQRPQLEANLPWPADSFLVLGYHDVEDDAADQRYLAVRTSALNDQFAWLRDHGYHPVSVQQIIDAHNGVRPLPAKAVLLTFDDGYRSFYDRVWPLLQAYKWPALWAPVGSWVDAPPDQKVDFGGLMTARNKFATWDMVRELSKSPLVEIGSHTWNSHYGSQANPQGSQLPAVANRLYDKNTGQYETDAQFTQRIENDVVRITNKLKEVTGKAPRAWVWPYGASSGTSLAIAKKHGYQLAFTLQDGLANTRDLSSIPRVLISGNPNIREFATTLNQVQEVAPKRVMHVDLDYVYDENPVQQKANIDKLIQRVFDMKITHVYLQAFADPTGDGTVKSVYFHNSVLPVREDLFNYMAWQLSTRAGVTVYAWMPVMAVDLDPSIPRVEAWDPKTNRIGASREHYQRVSPWSPQARQQITQLYQDLARYSMFRGILFHDDAMLTDFEDASPVAMDAYHEAGFNGTIGDIRSNPETFQRWTRYKSRYLIDFTRSLTDAVRDIRGPFVKTSRNIYAMPVLEPESEAWFAQNMNDFLSTYDWVAPMAMPLMEGVPLNESNAWLDKLVRTVAKNPNALNKTVFELQARDWTKDENHSEISGAQLAEWMKQLQMSGAKHFGYYPDDFINDKPEMSQVRPAFSSYWYPKND
ncbi:poly-beta-1,6-N-acetyl-D-glucosamine N-deacetylase PgaB [Atlantibacter hermannii]|uniref:poly-beta-1,6-N-acetyl-D-glucosamine N-deacetylase PgaB n=1 Tax=Atlantibacter hermannii TaxID=565 RepID=UPI0028AC9F5D|nr:poly-beta-1,6-N-acetyl-D-glucosamine N-deacetylase PgaB [Atlantibacter hermannii]